MHKLKYFLLIALSMLSLSCQGKKMMKIEQPHYYIKLNMQSCVRMIAVNGFLIERERKGYSSTAEIPINHVIKNGENQFELIVPKQSYVEKKWSENSHCEVQVRVSGLFNDEEVDFKVADIIFTPDYSEPKSNLHKLSMKPGAYKFEKGSTVLSSGGQDSVLGEVQMKKPYDKGWDGVFQRTFTANVPFPKWAFFDGDILFDGYFDSFDDDVYYAAEDILWPKVEELWDFFENKEIDKILPMFEFRSKEYDQAFYREQGSTLSQLKNSIENVYASEYPIDRYKNENMQLLLSYENNLVTMVNAATYNGTVMFYDHKSNSHTFYTVYWMKKDGEWIIAR